MGTLPRDLGPHGVRIAVVLIANDGPHGERRRAAAGDGQEPLPPSPCIRELPRQQSIDGEHCEDDDGRERQVHAMLEGQVGNRHDAGSRRENEEEAQTEEAELRQLPHGPKGQEQQCQDNRPRQIDGQWRCGDRPAVVEAERIGPEAEPQIVQDDASLRTEVFPRRHPLIAEAGVAAVLAAEGAAHRRRQPGERRQEGEVERPALLDSAAPASGEERPVVEQHHQRASRGNFLGGDAAAVGQPGEHVPRPFGTLSRRRRSSQYAIEAKQKAEPHQGLEPLDEIRDAGGLQRMNGPQQGGCEGEPGGIDAGRPAVKRFGGVEDPRRTLQRFPDQQKKYHGRGGVNGDVHRVVAKDSIAMHGVVELQRIVAKRTASAGGGPESPNGGVVPNPVDIVEHVGRVQPIGEDAGDDDCQHDASIAQL